VANDAKMVCTKLEIELGSTELPLTDRSHAIVIAKHSHFRIGIAGVRPFVYQSSHLLLAGVQPIVFGCGLQNRKYEYSLPLWQA
jgi:hypothetical protein